MKKIYVFIFISLWITTLAAQPNCNQTSVGFTPINDLGTGLYNGWMGGLYPNGSNFLPAAHKSAGLLLSSQIQPLDTSGNPDPVNGWVVWLSIGFSNTTQESSVFIPLAYTLPNLNPRLSLIDGAVGGQSATVLSTPTNAGYNNYWTTVNTRLANNGLVADQVQVIWFKNDNPAGTTPIDVHSDTLYAQTKRIMNELKNRFPNVKLCYIASRIYGGYAAGTLNPEPYAYRNGWTMKKVIEDQINGDSQLEYSGAGANAPWLSWGVYQWADGTTPRSDGLTWICPDDYLNDGTHPSVTGRQKVADMLLNFFQTDSTACSWFLNNCAIATGNEIYNSDDEINIYPNPVSDNFNLTFPPHKEAGTLIVYDITGNIILEEKIPASTVKQRINISKFKGGVYFCKINRFNKSVNIKFIKK